MGFHTLSPKSNMFFINRTCEEWSSQESACSCEAHFIKKDYKMSRTTFSLFIHDWRSSWICTTFLFSMKWVGKWPFCRGKAPPFHRGTIKGDLQYKSDSLATRHPEWKYLISNVVSLIRHQNESNSILHLFSSLTGWKAPNKKKLNSLLYFHVPKKIHWTSLSHPTFQDIPMITLLWRSQG